MNDDEIFNSHDPSYDADYIPNQNNESGRVVERTVTASIETPFLPPKFVEEYERIVPGAGQKMFDMVVKQQEFNMEIKRHDMQLNEKSLERVITVDAANINEQKEASIIRGKEVAIKSRGQIFAFILTCCLIALSGFFAYIDQPWLASLPIGIIIGVITVMFLQRKHEEEKKIEPSE